MATFTAKIFANGTMKAYVDGVQYSVNKEHPAYKAALEAFRADDADTFLSVVDVQEVVNKFTQGKAEIKDGQLYYAGKPVHNGLANRIIELQREGFDVSYMLNFLDNLMQNPSYRAVQELYDFLEHKGMPITPDGCFIAYKSVRGDYYSKTAGNLTLLQGKVQDGRIYNAVGEVVECVRHEVDEARDRHCSQGLHCGAYEYAGPGGWFNSGGDRVMVVKVNPRDAVSVPNDHSFTKLRVCRYEVIDEYKDMPKKSVYVGDESDYEEYDDVVYLEPEDLVEGREYVFDYDGEERSVLVEKVDDNSFLGRLVYPEEKAGEYRRFLFDKMDGIEETV